MVKLVLLFALIAVVIHLAKSATVVTNFGGSPDMRYKLLLTVYYESICPDSKAFILEHLQPAMQLLHKYVKLQLVPFGKATSVDYGFGGFNCQHGPSECLGNMIQDCALHLMSNRTDLDRVAYVACEMETQAASKDSMECVRKVNMKPNLVRHCVEYGKGTFLQLDSEYYTNLINPKFIPTITLDGLFDQRFQDGALVDLIGSLCEYLSETVPCATHYNNIVLKYLMFPSDNVKVIPIDGKYI